MPPVLLSGTEALVQGAMWERVSLFVSPSFVAFRVNDALVDHVRVAGGVAAESPDAHASLAAALEIASTGGSAVVGLNGEDVASADPYFAKACGTCGRLLFLILGNPGRGLEGAEGADHRELAPLRWAGGGALDVLVPSSPAECYAHARAAVEGARGLRPTAIYVDHVVQHMREPVEAGAEEAVDTNGYRFRDADTLVVAVGSVGRSAMSAVRSAREQGIRAGFYRPTLLWPGEHSILPHIILRTRRVLVAELNERHLWEPFAAELHSDQRRVLPLWPKEGEGRIAPRRILEEVRNLSHVDAGTQPAWLPETHRRGTAIRLAGDPAHGLLFTGYVLAEAALIDRRAVAHGPSHGSTARGPLSGGTLRIAGDPSEDPVVDAADYLLVTSSPALQRFSGEVAPEGRLVAEESLPGLPDGAFALPLVRTAVEAGGTPMVVDLVAAAVVTEMTGVVSRRALHEAAERLLPARGRPAGMAALDAGLELGKRLLRA